MPLSNKERFELLLTVGQEMTSDSEALDALIEDAEAAVIRDEDAEDEGPSPFVAIGGYEMDEYGNRYHPDGSLVFSPEAPGRML